MSKPAEPACRAAWLDRTWGDRSGHPYLALADDSVIEFRDFAIVRRPLAGGASTVIPSGFVYGMEPVYGGGNVYWQKSVEEKRDARGYATAVRIATAPLHGGAVTEIPGELDAPARIYGAGDGVYLATQRALVHLDRSGAQTVAIADRVTAVAVDGDTMYAAVGGSIVRQPVRGGELVVVARLRRAGQVEQIVATGDRVVWIDTSSELQSAEPGTETPELLGQLEDAHLAAARGAVYAASGNVLYAVGRHRIDAIGVARASVRALVTDGVAMYALVDRIGLARMCRGSVTLKERRDDLPCPPGHTSQWLRDRRHICIDAQGGFTWFHRDWYASGDLEEERLPDGTYHHWWADGTLVTEGHYDENDERDGTWTTYGDEGTEIERYDHGRLVR